jgi:hypothetical protein
VKNMDQKYGSNGALGNFDGSPNSRIQPKDPRKTRTRPMGRAMGRVLGGYPWAVGTHSAVF